MAEADPSKENSFFHDAFISYSRKDTPFAAAIERALERYNPPRDLPAPHRRLVIFRDTEDFTGTEYFASVERHLQGSRKLIVICSPSARRSDYVNDEIRRFAQSHTAADIISVLIAGIPNNEAKSHDAGEMAFPEALVERLEVPLASDYRNFNPKSDKPASGNYRQAWYKLLADIYGCSRAEVEQREQRRRVRQRIQWASAAAVITLAIGVSLYAADYQRRTAKSNEFADQALQLADADPEHALDLARQAVDQSATNLSASALRVTLAKMPDLLIPITFPPLANEDDYRSPAALAFTPDGRRMAIGDAQPRILDLESGRTVQRIADEGTPSADLRFSPDGLWLALIDEKHNTALFDAAGKAVAKIKGELHWRQPPAAGTQAVILSDKSVQIGELDNAGSWRSFRELTPRDYIGPAQEPYDSSSRELSPDGRRMASLAMRGDAARLTVTDLDSGQTVSQEFRSPPGLSKLSWSPDGAYIAAASLFGFAVVESRSLQSVLQKDSGNEITVEDVSLSPDGKLLAATSRDGTTTLWDLKKGKKAAELSGSPAMAYDPVFSPDGNLVSVCFSDDRVYLFAIDAAIRASGVSLAPEPIAIFDPIWGGARAARFTREGSALVIEYANDKLAVWKTARWRPERTLPLKYDARYEAGVPEGLEDIGIAADYSAMGVKRAGAWRVWSIISGSETAMNGDALKPLDKIILSEAGDLQLRNAMVDETTVYLVDRSTERQRYPLKHSARVMSKTFSPDGNCILTTSRYFMASGEPPPRADVARLWDTETGVLLREWRFGYGEPDSAFFTGRGRFVVLSEGDGFVYETTLCGSLDKLRHLATLDYPPAVHVAASVEGSKPPARLESPSEPEGPALMPGAAAPAPASLTETPVRSQANTATTTGLPIAPSFSCSGKLAPVEALICNDGELARLDLDLSQAYRKKMQDLQGKDRQRLVLEQRAWLQKRAGCANKGDLKHCVENAFRQRRAALDLR